MHYNRDGWRVSENKLKLLAWARVCDENHESYDNAQNVRGSHTPKTKKKEMKMLIHIFDNAAFTIVILIQKDNENAKAASPTERGAA